MTAFTERAAIRQRMEEIRIERRQLNDEYHTMFDRLRELDEDERQAIDAESVIGGLSDAVKLLSQLVPNIPAATLITHVAEQVEQAGMEVRVRETQQEENQIVPSHVVAAQQYIDSERYLQEKPQPKKKKLKIKSKEFETIITTILNEQGTPMRLQDLREAYDKEVGEEILDGTFFNRLTKVIGNNPKIEKVSRGYYQYRM